MMSETAVFYLMQGEKQWTNYGKSSIIKLKYKWILAEGTGILWQRERKG